MLVELCCGVIGDISELSEPAWHHSTSLCYLHYNGLNLVIIYMFDGVLYWEIASIAIQDINQQHIWNISISLFCQIRHGMVWLSDIPHSQVTVNNSLIRLQ